MNSFNYKVSKIFVPYIIISATSIIVYSFINWLCFVRFNFFTISYDVADEIIPMAIVWLPILIWLRPRLFLLNIQEQPRFKPYIIAFLFTAATIVLPMVFAQQYMVAATGRLIKLNYASDVVHYPASKYYTVNHYHISKRLARTTTVTQVTDKERNFYMALYFAVPVFDMVYPNTSLMAKIPDNHKKALVIIDGIPKSIEALKEMPVDSIRSIQYMGHNAVQSLYGTSSKCGVIDVITMHNHFDHKPAMQKINPPMWIGIKYSQTISNSSSTEEKSEALNRFVNMSEAKFNQSNLDGFKYLDRMRYNFDLATYHDLATGNDTLSDVNGPLVVMPVYESLADQKANYLKKLLLAFVIGSTLFLCMLVMVELTPGCINF